MTFMARVFVSSAVGALIGALPAFAADLPVKAAPVPVAIYNWTGFYAGGHVGYGIGMTDWLTSSFDYQVKGFLGGGQIGYNQQVGNVVFGIEADASWGNIKGDQALFVGGAAVRFNQMASGGTTIDGLGTLTARLGLAQDRWLVYVKGGAAWAHERHNHAATGNQVAPPLDLTANGNGSEDRFGYVFGIGSEWAFWGNWSFKSEYNYVHLGTREVRLAGSRTINAVTTPLIANFDIQQSLHLAKFGVNYRFGPDAPPAIAPARSAPGYDWTGAWVGAQVGYGWGHKHWPGYFVPTDGFDVKGWLGGVSTGANVQVGVFVLGVESEWLWSGIDGGRRDVVASPGLTRTTDLATNVKWLSLNSVRVGFVPADRWLVYGKGGVAFARERHNVSVSDVTGPGSEFDRR